MSYRDKRLAEAVKKAGVSPVNGVAPPVDPAAPAEWEPIIPLAAVPEADPFPLDVLPPLLQRFVREVAEAKHSPPDYAAVPLLAIAGGAIGASRALSIKAGWSERPCLWAAIVARPGSAKTPAIRDVALPVYAEQARLRGEHRLDGGSGKSATVYVDDITTEAMAQLLGEQPRGVTMIRDELSAWAGGMNQYKAAGRGADRQVFLKSWSGEPISVHRKVQEDGPIYVGHPFIGICGGMTPAGLAALCADDGVAKDDGFLDRILFSFPAELPAIAENWLSVSDGAAGSWADVLRQLWGLQAHQERSGQRPHFVHLDPSGRAAWERFTAHLAQQMGAEDFPQYMHGPLAKARGYCARLGLILHCLRQASGDSGHPDQVDGQSIDAAARLMSYFHSHTRKVYASFGADMETEDSGCNRVLRWIVRNGLREFTRRDALRGLESLLIKNMDDLDRIVGRLVKHGYIRERTTATPRTPGRPKSPTMEVNLEWLKTVRD